MIRGVLFLSTLLALTCLPAAQAQTQASVQIAVDAVPTTTVNTNDTVYVEPFTLRLTLQYAVCSTPTDYVFEILPAAQGGSGNRTTTFAVTPSSPRITVPAGQHVVSAFSATTEPTLQIRPGSIPYGGGLVNVTLGARGGPAGTGCQANGGLSAQAEPKAFTIHFRRGTEDPVVTPTPAMPGPDALALMAAAGLALGLMRPRRGA